MPLTTAALTLICSTWVDWHGYAGTPELCYAHSEEYHFVYNREGCNVYHYWLERKGHEIVSITTIPHKMGECGPDDDNTTSDEPQTEQKPVEVVGNNGDNTGGNTGGDSDDTPTDTPTDTPEDQPDSTPDNNDNEDNNGNRGGGPRGDNSDANGKGGNKHDRDDFTHGGTETAENKK